MPPGEKLTLGNHACALGAIAAGCGYFGGYPITPSSEIMEFMARELPRNGGKFMQMEDEIASIGSVIGAAWAGAKAMTATSGPGMSLMQENIGYACMTETPCVIVDIQRAGPSTGQATRVASADVFQARFGSHGDFETIALSPWSVQEMYDMTIHAFNLAERYRNPVYVLADEAVGHLREKISLHKDAKIIKRARRSKKTPFGDEKTNGMTPMPAFGQGRKLLVTGSTHDHDGFRRTADPEVQRRLVERITTKITRDRDKLARIETHKLKDAGTAIVAYGFTARAAYAAVERLRADGKKAGLLRLAGLWPFPSRQVGKLLEGKKRILVCEMNRGQVVREIERAALRRVEFHSRTTGDPINPSEIIEAVRRLS